VAVAGDGLCHRPPGYRGLVPEDWPSIRQTNGFDASAPITEQGAKLALRRVHAQGALICGGRYCFLCSADLSDAGVLHQSTSVTGYKAATGVYPEWTLAIPRGGHAPDCPVPYLLRWLGEPESVFTRMRTVDIDDEQAKLLAAAKSPAELVGTNDELLTPEQREARDKVLQGFGYELPRE